MPLPSLSHITLDTPEIRAQRIKEAKDQLSNLGTSKADKALAKRILALCEALPILPVKAA